jgi:hypothetical protein
MRFAVVWVGWTAAVLAAAAVGMMMQPGPAVIAGIGWQLIGALAVVYPVPAFLAWARRHDQAPVIAAVDLLLGWTLVGWIAAFALAIMPAHDPSWMSRIGSRIDHPETP